MDGELDYPDGFQWEDIIGPCWVYEWEYTAEQHDDYGEYEEFIDAGIGWYYSYEEAAHCLWVDVRHSWRELLHCGRPFWIRATVTRRWRP